MTPRQGQRRSRVRFRSPSRPAPPRIGLTMGDPAGVGPEIILKTLAMRPVPVRYHPILFGHPPLFHQLARRLRIPLQLAVIDGRAIGNIAPGAMPPGVVPIVPIPMASRHAAAARASAAGGRLAARAIETATAWAQAGALDAITTAPINKVGLARAGYTYEGHTEFFAALARSPDVGMMMIGGGLKIMLVTTHVAMRQLPRRLTSPKIFTALRLTDRALRDWFGIKRPRIGVCGLNPHAGDQGRFGREEAAVILPAIRRARRHNIRASGPFPADSLFVRARAGEFDATVAMYHDQALIPIKVLAFGRAVNLSVGLPFIRTSVDHGTAYDIAGKGIADPGSMLEAIKLAATLAARR